MNADPRNLRVPVTGESVHPEAMAAAAQDEFLDEKTDLAECEVDGDSLSPYEPELFEDR